MIKLIVTNFFIGLLAVLITAAGSVQMAMSDSISDQLSVNVSVLQSTPVVPQNKPVAGVISHRIASGSPAIEYFLYIPSTPVKHPVLVSVHGISRNAREHIESFVESAEQRGVILVAPYFDKQQYSDFQRLGRVGKGSRADEALHRILNDVSSLVSVNTHRFLLYGHSGGGQFAHRYAMAHPEKIIRYAVSSAGWYTLPELGEKFPRGMKSVRSLPGVSFNIEDYLKVPGCAFVGDQDVARDDAFNKSARLDSTQGRNRVERAESWVSSMVTAARWRGLDTSFSFKLLPNSGHDFTEMVRNGNLVDEVTRCLLD